MFSLGYVNSQFELLPINTAIQTAAPPFQHKLSIATEERLEQCFDDLRSTQVQVNKYEDEREDDDEDDDDVWTLARKSLQFWASSQMLLT